MRGSGDERTVAVERAGGHEHVHVRVPVCERAEALDADDDASGGVARAEGGALIFAERVVDELAQLAETAVTAPATPITPCVSVGREVR
jgi:hypothetical protein